MAVDHVKSTFITNLDASPSVANTAGEGGPAVLKTVEGSLVTVTLGSEGATYQLVRVPSNCKIKSLLWESAAQGAGHVDVGLYYASDGEGGKPAILLVANAIDANFFAAELDLASAIAITEEVNQSGTYTIDKRTQPIWQAAGLTSDPGGYFDVVATVTATTITTGATRIGCRVQFTD